MDKIREQLKNPYVSGAVGLVVGLLFGLIVLGWGLFPVKWVNASPQNLRPDLQEEYLKMAVQSFSVNNNISAAQQHWKDLGTGATKLLTELQASNSVKPEQIGAFQAALMLVPSITTTPATAVPTGTVITTLTPTQAPATKSTSLLLPLLLLCLLLILIAAALAYIFLIRGRSSSSKSTVTPMNQTQAPTAQPEKVAPVSKGQEPPVAQFMTTYMVGEDAYDDSFSIDSSSGEFLGECGVGISETIGVGEPKKVTAFEVWLFDKNDIQTVTKVLMSPHAFDDPTIHQRLESKGEPVLIESGKHILLETATLQLEARVVDMNFGQGAMPTNSYFDRLTLELAVWPKPSV